MLIKNVDKFSKIKFDNEKTESINEIQKMVKNIDEKYLSSKTKEKLYDVFDDIALEVYILDDDSEVTYWKRGGISEFFKLLKVSNKRLNKKDEYSVEEEDFEKLQNIIVEAVKETIQSKTTEKTHKSLF